MLAGQSLDKLFNTVLQSIDYFSLLFEDMTAGDERFSGFGTVLTTGQIKNRAPSSGVLLHDKSLRSQDLSGVPRPGKSSCL